MRAHADLLVSTGLHKLGYEYVNLDGGWGARARDPHTKRLLPDPKRFPGIADGSLAACAPPARAALLAI